MTEYRCHGWENRLACLLLTDPVHNWRLRELLDSKQDGVDRGWGVETDGGQPEPCPHCGAVSDEETASAKVQQVRASLLSRPDDPPTLSFPDGWTTSQSWDRAHQADSQVGVEDPATFSVMLGYVDKPGLGDRHRVLFAVLDANLVAECPCNGFEYFGFCAHVGHLWWLWCNDELAVRDLDSGEMLLEPPESIGIRDFDKDDVVDFSRSHVATDGGGRE